MFADRRSWFAGACLSMMVFCLLSCSDRVPVEAVLSSYNPDGAYAPVTVLYPRDDTVFPADLAPFTFTWEAGPPEASWLLLVEPQGGGERMTSAIQESQWTPSLAEWERIKRATLQAPAQLTVLRVQNGGITARGVIRFRTSADPVGAPIFYREVNLPFMEAVKDPSRIRWRFGSVDSLEPPPVVLEKLPVCGNCHSFSRDGQTLGMDVDYANNKGSYVITSVAERMKLAPKDIISWGDFHKEDGQPTYGLLSQVSPDGRTVLSTVKDKSVFVARPDLEFSQLFFPIKGILVAYDRATRQFAPLPGADDPDYVQSNPTWSPDGRYVVFARAKAYQLRDKGAEQRLLLTEEDCAEFLRDGKPFQFELYRVPYNGGRGGVAEPLPGASKNGRSNFFPRYSPDGKWIIFCQARNYMLLQPDSELYMIPAEGGEPRRLRCNTGRMNSWHSWSPNGKWLVFSSKAHSPYTQLFLTHIDEHGESSPPVVLSRFTAPDRAANIPEFVNLKPGAIQAIQEQFLDDISHARAGYFAENSGDPDKAIREYELALQANPSNAQAHQRLGYLLYHIRNEPARGLNHTLRAIKLDPRDGCARFDLGLALVQEGKLDEGIRQFREAVRLLPEGFGQRYSAVELRCALGDALSRTGDATGAAEVLRQGLALAPQHARSHYLLALVLLAQGDLMMAEQHFTAAMQVQPAVDVSPELHFLFSIHYERAGRLDDARQAIRKALELAPAGNAELRQMLQDRQAALR